MTCTGISIGSLFSGIGGLELGLELAGLGPVRWQVEQNPWCRQVLARHWPGVAQHEDVNEIGAHNLEPVDLICGGFPCQDVSSAGARAGLSGQRSGLWRQFSRVLSALRPRWVVVENVASGAHLWVDEVSGALREQGYEVLPVPLSAWDVGAPHGRPRVFLVGYTDGATGPAPHAVRGGPPGGNDPGGRDTQPAARFDLGPNLAATRARQNILRARIRPGYGNKPKPPLRTTWEGLEGAGPEWFLSVLFTEWAMGFAPGWSESGPPE